MTDCIWVFAFVPGGLRSSKSIAQNPGCYSGLSDSISSGEFNRILAGIDGFEG